MSWGKNGNQAVGNYLSFTAYTIGQTHGAGAVRQRVRDDGPSRRRPIRTSSGRRRPRPTSGWTSRFWSDRITGSLDYYTKETTTCSSASRRRRGPNLSNFITTNSATVRNRGFELGLNARLFDGGDRGFTWTGNLNVANNKNELLSINRAGVSSILTGGISGGVGSLHSGLQPGKPMNSFFVYEHKLENGKPVYRDVNGDGQINEVDLYVDRNGDGIVNQSDRRAYESPQPEVDPRAHVEHGVGRVRRELHAARAPRQLRLQQRRVELRALRRPGEPNGPANLHASVLETGFRTAQYLSDAYVEDASFLRMDNITVGYTFARVGALREPRLFAHDPERVHVDRLQRRRPDGRRQWHRQQHLPALAHVHWPALTVRLLAEDSDHVPQAHHAASGRRPADRGPRCRART